MLDSNIGGPGKTGSSTISSRLAQDLNAPRLYGGQYMRTEAIKAGFVKDGYLKSPDPNEWDLDQADVSGFRRDCKQRQRDIDKEMEMYLLNGMVEATLAQSDVVIESKVMNRFLHSPVFPQFLNEINSQRSDDQNSFITPQDIRRNSRGVWLHSNIQTRAERSLLKRSPLSRSVEGALIPLDKNELVNEIKTLSERQLVDGEDYAQKYGMTDYPGPHEQPGEGYGLVIDTSRHCGADQTYRLVRELLGV
ncbi:MAG TPA: hypothetical protein PKU95_02855 [Candidatus Dojkabacteria bacterium]|nr:hypothetical protein [Candidatus Dojkabacteria bacterium]